MLSARPIGRYVFRWSPATYPTKQSVLCNMYSLVVCMYVCKIRREIPFYPRKRQQQGECPTNETALLWLLLCLCLCAVYAFRNIGIFVLLCGRISRVWSHTGDTDGSLDGKFCVLFLRTKYFLFFLLSEIRKNEKIRLLLLLAVEIIRSYPSHQHPKTMARNMLSKYFVSSCHGCLSRCSDYHVLVAYPSKYEQEIGIHLPARTSYHTNMLLIESPSGTMRWSHTPSHR